jgi:peroxiredoxin
LRSFQQHLPELARRGIRPVAISVDPPDVTREHIGRMGWTYTFLSDPHAEAIRRYDLLHQVTAEQMVARPGEFLIDPTGTVRWLDLTEDYKVRTRPETALAVFDELNGQAR